MLLVTYKMWFWHFAKHLIHGSYYNTFQITKSITSSWFTWFFFQINCLSEPQSVWCHTGKSIGWYLFNILNLAKRKKEFRRTFQPAKWYGLRTWPWGDTVEEHVEGAYLKKELCERSPKRKQYQICKVTYTAKGQWLARRTRDLVVAGSIPNQAML